MQTLCGAPYTDTNHVSLEFLDRALRLLIGFCSMRNDLVFNLRIYSYW
jgi:hypothetical protein